MPADNSPPAKESAVPWNDVVRFVRQLSHDLRNHLNAAELQSVYLNELTTDAEMKTEIKRLRAMVSELGTVLQKLTGALAQPKPNVMPYRAADLLEDIRQKFEKEFSDRKSAMQWQVEVGDAMFNVDPQLVQQAVFELFENAFRHAPGTGPLDVTARIESGQVVLTLREPKAQFDANTEEWGRMPLRHVTQGHYGLGLNRVRAILEANGGTFRADYDSTASTLVTTIRLPSAGVAN